VAATVIAHLLQKQLGDRRVTKVAGVPTMGTFLSVMLAEELNVPLVTTRKGKHVPTRWEQAVVLEDNMKQYKNGAIASHIYNGLCPGDVVLFTDDVLGDGTTLLPIIKWMLNFRVTPYVGVYAAKLYRPGYEALLKLGIHPVYVYGIEAVHRNREVVLGPTQIR